MDLTPKIIFEDEAMLVLDKPTGLAVHGDGYKMDFTLADWLIENYPDLQEVGESMIAQNGELILRPGIVHRLDKDTSGIMVVAKNQKSFTYLKQQFKDRQIEKIYHLITVGIFADPVGEKIIDLPIGRSSKNPKLRVASPKAHGRLRPAETIYQVLETFKDYSYIEARPKTGRTHQLRVHFKALQHPILNDPLYGKGLQSIGELKRLALHAHRLKLTLSNGKKVDFTAPMPKDLISALDNLKDS